MSALLAQFPSAAALVAALCTALPLLLPRIRWLLSGPKSDFHTHAAPLSSTAYEGKVVWITGASSGIGLAVARAVTARGARVILTARRASTLSVVAASLPCPRSHVVVLPLDLSAASPDDIQEAVRVATCAFSTAPAPAPRLDYLFNNAGKSTRSLAAEFHPDNLRAQMALNFLSPVALTLACLPLLRASPTGTVVNTSSIASLICTPLRAPYCASKAALSRFHECLRLEMSVEGAGDRVRIVDVCPGSVKTDVARNAMAGPRGAVHGESDANIDGGLDAAYVGERMAAAAAAGLPAVWLLKGREFVAIYLAYYAPAAWAAVGPPLMRKFLADAGVRRAGAS
jgi:NAD(P)-dependent dehydrogenase (short-subunit alcohol dehydrogenase family)